MFYGVNKRKIQLATITLCTCLLLLTPLLGIRALLQQASQKKLHAELQHYIERTKINSLLNVQQSIPLYDLEQITPLAFVRILFHGKEVTITRAESKIDAKQILLLPKRGEKNWLSNKKGVRYSLQTYSLSPELHIQAGIIVHEADVFQKISVLYTISILLFCPLFFSLLLHIQRHGEKKLMALSRELTQLPLAIKNDETRAIRQQIITIISNNEKLVRTTQETLDNIAHDLRTPLARLRSTAEYALRQQEPQALSMALSTCLEESLHISEILRVMMSVAEAESGTMQLERQNENLEKGIMESIELYSYIAEEKEINIEFTANSPLTSMVDPTRIRQVWANLLDNAIKYGKIGGWVKISCHSNDHFNIIEIADNGIGIAPYETTKIWKRLYRGDRSRSEKGLGLGLNYVLAVIEAHGGQISVESTLHEGSCFSVALPRITQ